MLKEVGQYERPKASSVLGSCAFSSGIICMHSSDYARLKLRETSIGSKIKKSTTKDETKI